jgi:carboxyl-terminal processing protease
MPLNNWVRLPDSGKLKLTVSKFYRVAGGTTQKQGVTSDIILPTPYDYMEIGEATLPNCLESDHTQKLAYRRVNRVVGHVDTLTKLSNGRISNDQDFSYILEDIDTLKERLKDKSVSLSEAKRLAEKDDNKAKREERKIERKARGDAEETVFDLTIKMIKTDTKLGEEIEDEEKPIRLEVEPEDGEEIKDEEDQPKLDPHMRETLHILHDYIKLLNPKKQIAAKERVQ